MDKSLVLFDVDATLLLTHGAGMRAMKRAGTDVFGPDLSWDGIEASGGLDPLLVAEAARRSQLPFTPERHEAFRQRYVVLLEEELARSSKDVHIMPGALELLTAVHEHPQATLGVLTGNYATTGAIKLRAIGVDPAWFEVSVFGDEADSRPGLVTLAIRKYAALGRGPLEPSRVVVIGDTPRDVEAALQNGCRALGVATGKYDVEALEAAGAHTAVNTLEDPSKLWALLNGHTPPASGPE